MKAVASSKSPFTVLDRCAWQIVLGVVLLHLLGTGVAIVGWPQLGPRKSEITIELGGVISGGGGGVAARPAAVPTPTAPSVKPSTVKDELATKRAAETSKTTQPATSAPTQPASAAAGGDGPAGAPTTDADYKAAYLNNPKPPYPSMAFQLRIEGTVRLKALVLPDGTCGEVLLAQSSGNELLDQSALTTVAKWKFVPAKAQGKDIAQWVSIPIKFSVKRL